MESLRVNTKRRSPFGKPDREQAERIAKQREERIQAEENFYERREEREHRERTEEINRELEERVNIMEEEKIIRMIKKENYDKAFEEGVRVFEKRTKMLEENKELMGGLITSAEFMVKYLRRLKELELIKPRNY